MTLPEEEITPEPLAPVTPPAEGPEVAAVQDNPYVTNINEAYGLYKTDPTPQNLGEVVNRLKPTIQYGLASFSVADDPYLKSQARLLAAKAIQKYDPSHGAALHTWVSGQLKQLSRMKRQSRLPVKIPERAQLSARHLMQQEMEFMDKYGREPDVGELSDFSKIPIQQIKKIRRVFLKMPSESAMGEGLAGATTDFTGEALDYLYHDLDHIDRKILEMKTGYGGADVLAGPVIMRKLGITPTQMSRRSARIALRLNEIETTLQKVVGGGSGI